MSENKNTLDHNNWNLSDVIRQAKSDEPLVVSESVLGKVNENRQYLEQKLAGKKDAIYGINTGFGSLCHTIIPTEGLEDLQVNLVRSHACGTGDLVDKDIIRLMILLKIKSLSYGYSGIRVELLNKLVSFYNEGICPVIYEQGSLGASGDLAPLAHMSLSLMGEGEVHSEEGITPSLDILQTKGIQPLKLQAKEGLALLNGTQFMLAHLVHCLHEGIKMWHQAHEIAALSIEGFNCRLSPYFEGLGQIRAHEGQQKSAEMIRKLLHDSGLEQAEGKAVQDPYSFRCIPQVHGATYTTLMHCKKVAEVEANAATDNPVVFDQEDRVISGGNFHGQELALALDFLGIALAELANISERRTYLLVSGERGLPAYLSKNPGVCSGFMIPQYTAASIVSQNKQLASPASIDSIPSSNGQEDHVSMGANAATKCKRIVDNLRRVLAIELMNAAQAWDFQDGFEKSSATKNLHAEYRKKVTFLENDRYLAPDIQASVDFLRSREV